MPSAQRTDLSRIPPRSSLRYTERYSKERLTDLRKAGDPPADAIMEELHTKHGGLKKIHDMLVTVQAKAQIEGETGQIFRDFLASTSVIPEWADAAKVERGQRIHNVMTPFMGLSLFAGSLVGGAQFATAAVVTALAGNITTNPTRRIDETGALLLSIAFPGSLWLPGREAHDSLTRVRLLHAALRHWLPRSGRLKAHPHMVPKDVYVQGELPINQEDLAITLGIFCYTNLRSLRHMGIILSSSDIDCYVHMWRYAGHVLGIQADLLPTSLEDQEEFMLAAMLHQGRPDNIPDLATKDFIKAFSKKGSRGTNGWVSEDTMQTFLCQLTRYLNGNEYTEGANFEDLGEGHWSIRLVKAMGWTFGTIVPRLPFGEEIMFRFHTRMLRKRLAKRGTPTGHGAGTGADITQDSAHLNAAKDWVSGKMRAKAKL